MERLKQIIKECIHEIINEDKVVKFNNKVYPNFGWCVIMAGGGGSGKGYSLNNFLPINGKIIDVDEFKKLYMKMNNNKIGNEEYDSLNPNHVSYVHKKVKEKGYKKKYTNNILNNEFHNEERKPNVIFDITGDMPDISVIELARMARNYGYQNIMLVWVISNRSEAIIRNLSRSRRIPDMILHEIHNSLADDMPDFLQSKLASDFLTDAWLIFNSTLSVRNNKISQEDRNKVSVPLQKTSKGFIIGSEVMTRIKEILGKQEDTPSNPSTYQNSEEVLKKYGKAKYDKNGKFIGYNFDRSKFEKDDLYQ